MSTHLHRFLVYSAEGDAFAKQALYTKAIEAYTKVLIMEMSLNVLNHQQPHKLL